MRVLLTVQPMMPPIVDDGVLLKGRKRGFIKQELPGGRRARVRRGNGNGGRPAVTSIATCHN